MIAPVRRPRVEGAGKWESSRDSATLIVTGFTYIYILVHIWEGCITATRRYTYVLVYVVVRVL